MYHPEKGCKALSSKSNPDDQHAVTLAQALAGLPVCEQLQQSGSYVQHFQATQQVHGFKLGLGVREKSYILAPKQQADECHSMLCADLFAAKSDLSYWLHCLQPFVMPSLN